MRADILISSDIIDIHYCAGFGGGESIFAYIVAGSGSTAGEFNTGWITTSEELKSTKNDVSRLSLSRQKFCLSQI